MTDVSNLTDFLKKEVRDYGKRKKYANTNDDSK